MHLSFALTVIAIPFMLIFAAFAFGTGRKLVGVFAVVAMVGLIGAAIGGNGSCISTVQSASSACAQR